MGLDWGLCSINERVYKIYNLYILFVLVKYKEVKQMGKEIKIDADGCFDFRDIQYINEKVNWWVAALMGLHPKYKYERDFIRTEYDSKGRKIPVVSPYVMRHYVGKIIEVRGGSWNNPNTRTYWRVVEVTDEKMILEPLAPGDVDKALAEKKRCDE